MSPVTRRTLIRGLLASGAAPILGGCRSGRVDSSLPLHAQVAQKARELGGSRSLKILYPKGSLGNLTPVAAAFYELTQIKLELNEASLDEISAELILSQHIGTAAFDVAIPATFGLPDLVEAGVLAELDDLERALAPGGQASRSLYTLGDRYRGRLYGYQTDGDVYIMFYNRAWLDDPQNRARFADQTGTPLAPAQTWAELDRQMAFFHDPGASRFGGSLYRNLNYVAWEYWSRLHAMGVYPIDDELVPRFDTPAGVAALQQLVEASRWLDPAAADHALFENFRAFAEGNKFCNIGWGGTQKYLRSSAPELSDAMTYGPLPGGIFGGQAVPMPYFNWGWNYVVSARSPVQELAYLFILFACTPWASTRSVREASGYFDPFSDAHYEDPVINEIYGSEFLAVHRQSLASCIPDLYLQGQGRYLTPLKQAVYAACRGQISPETALRSLTDRWNAITDEIGREGQKQQWRLIKESYPAPLKAILS